MAITKDDRPLKAPPRAPRSWGGFFHMLARHYQNYELAVLKAARRRKHRAVDVDMQESAEGTGWALHWATLGQNKLHDPTKQYGKKTRIVDLKDHELERMRGPKGEHPRRISYILERADERNVRVELEAKTYFSLEYTSRLMKRPYTQRLHQRGLLQVKTLASMGAPSGPVHRLRPFHEAGFDTMLSFSTWTRLRPPISKQAAWPVTDYVRGTGHWTD